MGEHDREDRPGSLPADGPLGGAPAPDSMPEPVSDPGWDAYLDEEPPPEWELDGPAVSLSLGDAADLDPALLAAICGPDGLGGQSLGPQFAQDRAADVLRPGPVLAALTEQAVTRAAGLADDELIGALRASRRLAAREAYKQAVLTAEYARRREAEFAAAGRRGTAAACRPGAFPGEELACELLVSRSEASRRIDTATDLAARLPATLAAMAAGLVDEPRAQLIAFHTRAMDPADAAHADEVLAEAAARMRTGALASKAAALEMKLAPEAVRARREHARQAAQRVEARREASGNASLSAREMDTAKVMASYAHLTAIARRLRVGGVDGSLDVLRVLAMSDLTQGLNPLDRITPEPANGETGNPDSDCPADSETGEAGGQAGNSGNSGNSGGATAGRGPGAGPALAAQVNLTLPLTTLLGWSNTPGQAGHWGLLDPQDTRDAARAAARHRATRWCLTLIAPDGTAVAHACLPGPQPLHIPGITDNTDNMNSPPSGRSPRDTPGSRAGPSPAGLAEQLAALLRGTNFTFRPIASGTCDHAAAEDRYTPSRTLRHLIHARNATCTAPGCIAPADYCDLDHTNAYPGGPTCPCNLGSLCRKHHRAKQAPDWKVEQTQPGVFRWTLPSGRTHTTAPTTYDG